MKANIIPCLIFTILLNACGLIDQTIKLQVKTDKNINQNIYNHSAPIVLNFYQLSSLSKVNSNSLERLMSSTNDISPQLLASKEITLRPKEKLNINLQINKNAKYLLIFAEFRHPGPTGWKEIIDLENINTHEINIYIKNNKLIIKERT